MTKEIKQFDYFYGAESQQFAFFRVPKVLVKDKKYKSLSSDAKILYGLMLDRMELSARNNWFDESNRCYIFYTAETIAEDLACCVRSAKTFISELKKIELIEIKQQGQGKPAKIYVKKFVSVAPLGVQNPAPLEVQNPAPLGVQNLHPNNTEYNKTELNNTENVCSSATEDGNFDILSDPPQKPTFEQIKKYIFDNDLVVDAQAFYRFYENTGWRHQRGISAGKPVSNWRNALLNWNRNDLQRAGVGGGCVQTQAGKILTAEEQNRLVALKKTIGMFDPVREAEEYNELKRRIEELEGRSE